MKIKAIIVDDEQDAIESLLWKINKYSPDIHVIESFTNPEEAISAINYLKPDCVFLDIEMPEIDGFQLLSKLRYRDFELIITTAYDHYALQAFKENAIDYLLKPIDQDDLIKVTDKVLKNKKSNNLGSDINNALKSIFKEQNKRFNKVALSLNGKTVFVKQFDINYCKADGNYTHVFMCNGESFLLSKKIKDVLEIIDSSFIIRVHQSYLVNINKIREYVKNDGYYLVLENRTTIPVSKANRVYLQEAIESN
jgi:two-component system LytT family response regulator